MHQNCPLFVAISGFLIILFGIFTAFYSIPNFIHYHFDQLIDLTNGSIVIQIFENGENPLNFKVYFFNVENPNEIMLGDGPILKQIGPYVYKRSDQGRILQINETEDTLTYAETRHYTFDMDASKNLKDTDKITIINPLLMIIISTYIDQQRNISQLDEVISAIFPNVTDFFIKVQVNDILFNGISVDFPENYTEVCNLLENTVHRYIEFNDNCSSLSFSFYKYLNGTEQRPVKITRGVKDTIRGSFVPHENDLDIWNDYYCNQINGTDLGILDNMEVVPERLYTFKGDFCRSIYLNFLEENTFFKLKTVVKFGSTKELFELNENTKCFCPFKYDPKLNSLNQDCPISGLMNLKTCIGIDLFISHPYYGYADSITGDFNNLFNEKLHNSVVYVEPVSGIPIYYCLRYQYSILIPKVENWFMTMDVSVKILPLFWVEEEFELDENVLQDLQYKHELIQLTRIIDYALIIFGIILMSISPILLGYKEQLCSNNAIHKNKKKSKIMVKTNENPKKIRRH